MSWPETFFLLQICCNLVFAIFVEKQTCQTGFSTETRSRNLQGENVILFGLRFFNFQCQLGTTSHTLNYKKYKSGKMKFTDSKKQIEQVFFSKKLKCNEGRFYDHC